MIIHRDIDLRKRGFAPISGYYQFRDMPGVGKLLKVARDENVIASAIVAFRIGTDIWGIYIRPGDHAPYAEQAILP